MQSRTKVEALAVVHDVGLLAHVPAAMCVVTLVPALWFEEFYALIPFAATAGVSLVVGQGMAWIGRRGNPDARPVRSLRLAMIAAAIGWLVVAILCAVPLLAIAWTAPAPAGEMMTFRSPLNSVFEAMSGVTSTGLTMAVAQSELPACVQWWRSLMQWVGGIGVIVLAMSLWRADTGLDELYAAEARQERILPSVRSTMKRIWWIYIVYSLVSVALHRLVGVPWWEAINHGMTGIATGGFSITDDSYASHGAGPQIVALTSMVLGSIAFGAHYEVLRHGRARALWRQLHHRALWVLLVSGSILLTLELAWAPMRVDGMDPVFQWISALATGGFQSADIASWSPTAVMLLSLAMIVGGASGSTTGGIKLQRLVLLYKGVAWRVLGLRTTEHQLFVRELDGETMSEAEARSRVESAAILVALWVGTAFVSTLVMLHLIDPHWRVVDVAFEVLSAQGNVGLSSGITGPGQATSVKVLLIITMWLGRLEIMPILVLLVSSLVGNRPIASRR